MRLEEEHSANRVALLLNLQKLLAVVSVVYCKPIKMTKNSERLVDVHLDTVDLFQGLGFGWWFFFWFLLLLLLYHVLGDCYTLYLFMVIIITSGIVQLQP